MYWNKEIETMSREKIEAIQLDRLKRVVRYCYEKVPFYKNRFDSIGLRPEDIQTLRDVEKIPYTTKADLRENYPDKLFAVPMKEVRRIHASSGTTGKPTVVAYTAKDLDMWSDCMARLITATGVSDKDVAQVCFGYGLFTGALGLHQGLEKVGCAVIPSSSGNTEKQLMMMKDLKSTVLIATPSYALYLSEMAKELGYKKEDFSLRIGLLGSEGCTVTMRKKIEENMGMFVTDNYGMSELLGPGVAGECDKRLGMHFAEDHFLPEIIDPETESVLERGAVGELVVTTLTKEALPLLRYRTRDLTSIDYSACPCGRTHARMGKTVGRSDDMLIIKGVNVFPSQIESAIIGMKHIGPHYKLIVRTEGLKDTLEVMVELANGELLERYSELEKLRASVKHRLLVVLGLDAKVSLVEPKRLERTAGKAKRVEDLRSK